MFMQVDKLLLVKKGSFGTVVNNNILHVPNEIGILNSNRGLRTAEEFFNFVNCFPSQSIADFGWALNEVYAAVDELRNQLQGFIHPLILNPPPPPQFSKGAMQP